MYTNSGVSDISKFNPFTSRGIYRSRVARSIASLLKKDEIPLEFVELVRQAALQESSAPISNYSPLHKKILDKQLLTIARDNKLPVRIICHNFSDEHFSGLENVVRECVASECEVTAIVLYPEQESVTLKNAFLTAIRSGKSGKVLIPKDSFDAIQHLHFLLVGKDKYRYSEGNDSAMGEGCFHAPLFGSFLKRQFEGLIRFITARGVRTEDHAYTFQHNNWN